MKDAKGHGSDSKGGGKFDETYGLKGGTPIGAPARPGATFPAHQQGVADAGRVAAFNIAKAAHDHLDAEHAKASAVLSAFPKGSMGMTAPEVKASPAFKAAKQNYDTAFQRLRNYNSGYVKKYGPEIKAGRLARRGG